MGPKSSKNRFFAISEGGRILDFFQGAKKVDKKWFAGHRPGGREAIGKPSWPCGGFGGYNTTTKKAAG